MKFAPRSICAVLFLLVIAMAAPAQASIDLGPTSPIKIYSSRSYSASLDLSSYGALDRLTNVYLTVATYDDVDPLTKEYYYLDIMESSTSYTRLPDSGADITLATAVANPLKLSLFPQTLFTTTFDIYRHLVDLTTTIKVSSGSDFYLANLSVDVVKTPTPIPGAFWLLGSGLAGLVGLRRRLA